jgi:hypothetical protein
MTSTYAIGTAFEKHAMKFLNHHLHMCVRRVGGSGDGGIDLRGWWFVPRAARRSLQLEGQRKTGGTRGLYLSRKYENRELARDSKTRLAGYGLNQPDQFGADGWTSLQGQEHSTDDDAVQRLRVLAQCKAGTKPVGTRYVREMEGVMAHFHGAS